MAVKKLRSLPGAFTFLATFFFVNAFAQQPRLIHEYGSVWARDLDPEVLYTFTRYFNSQTDWESVFPIVTKESTNGIVVSGTYKVSHDAVGFTPRFPFAIGVSYVATFHAEQLARNANEVYLPKMPAETMTLEFTLTPVGKVPATLVAIHPTSDVLPENLLKFHLTFSKSMSLGYVYEKVKLYDQQNNLVEKPFLILDQELWDEEMKTVTILFDPGRIKRGLRPNLEMKPALKAGEQYTLVVEEGWKDIDGQLTDQDFQKTFHCVAADRTSPSKNFYSVSSPQHRTAPLMLDLQEPHDFILLSTGVRVFDNLGNEIPGTLHVDKNDSHVQFVPKNPWLESRYTISINPLLEDLAGNNLNRLFDEDISASKSKDSVIHELSFTFSKSFH